MEALYESTPQSVLQLVYIMRTSEFNKPIYIISIVQSVLSMTKSMINSDNAYMGSQKFKIYKKRFPPSKEFLMHVLFRFCEISYRVGIFSLFWTVIGGLAFGILMIYELLYPLYWILVMHFDEERVFEWEELFLAVNHVRLVSISVSVWSQIFSFWCERSTFHKKN